MKPTEKKMEMPLDKLQPPVAVVDTGSATAAAEQPGLIISATNRMLGRLEKHCCNEPHGIRNRQRKGQPSCNMPVTLTSVDEAEEQIAARHLRVDAATSFMLHVIVPRLDGFRERYPDIEPELNSNKGTTDLIWKDGCSMNRNPIAWIFRKSSIFEYTDRIRIPLNRKK